MLLLSTTAAQWKGLPFVSGEDQRVEEFRELFGDGRLLHLGQLVRRHKCEPQELSLLFSCFLPT